MSENNTIESRLLAKLDMLVAGGFYIFMCAWFIASSRSAHHTIVYVFFLLPALIHLIAAIALKSDVLRIWRNPVFLSLTIFLAYMAISSTWSDNSEGLAHYAKRMLYTLLFVYGVYVTTRNGLKHFERALLTACVIAIPWLIINVTLFPEEAFINGRFFGLNAGIHYLLTGSLLGSYLLLLMTYLVNRMDEGLKLLPAIFIFVIAANLFYGVLLTESRSALLALAASGAYLFISIKGHNTVRYSLIGIGLLAVIAVAPYANEFIQRGYANRFEIWDIVWNRIASNPIFGHGTDAELIMHISSGEELYDAHNIHLEVLFEGGLAGFLLWSTLLLSIAFAGWESRREPLGKYILALLIYSVVAKAFESRGILSRPTEFWHLLWLCGGLAMAAQFNVLSRTEARNARQADKSLHSSSHRYDAVDASG